MPYLSPHEIEKRLSIRSVEVRPYVRSFAFVITWEDEAGARHPDATLVELAYPPQAQGFAAEADNSAHIFEIRLELERSGPTRAEQLGIGLDAYYAALDEWDGRVTVFNVGDTSEAFTTPPQIQAGPNPTGPYQGPIHPSDLARTASGKRAGR